ncbi:MAG: FG-GAP-like repeat-containing protein [Cyclobacteriaceae bacterium]|nr:FG-GAP-like repeat-containing protein [Cyclobacteriaceae bacterium]
MKREFISCLLSLVFSVCTFLSNAQQFTLQIPTNSIPVYGGSNAFVDIDNDGDLDFIANGHIQTNILNASLYLNTNGNFAYSASLSATLPPYAESPVGLINTNHDDRIDILFMGRRIGLPDQINRSSMLENTSTGFIDKGPLPNFAQTDGFGSFSVGDVNNDGWMDIFAAGTVAFVGGSPVNEGHLYINNSGVLQDQPASSFDGVSLSCTRMVDIDNDKDLDLIVAGQGVNQFGRTRVYVNDGLGKFTAVPSNLINLQNPTIAVADYDGDHDMDVLLSGLDQSFTQQTKLYRNNAGVFTEVSLGNQLTQTAVGFAQWGDYDNDGDMDILIAGNNETSPLVSILRNDGSNQFTRLTDSGFSDIGYGNLSWGDADNDGDLDILVTGNNIITVGAFTPVMYVLKNNNSAKNLAPSIPGSFTLGNPGDGTFNLSWSASTDDHTPAQSLTYNLSVRQVQLNQMILLPMADPISGWRRVADHGNMGLNTGWKFIPAQPGMYAIKVQAVDGGYMGSGWSPEKTVFVGAPTAPSSLVLAHQSGKARLSWVNNCNNAEYFVIERRLNGGAFQKVDSVSYTTLSYVDSYNGFETREYRVNAVNPNQRSAFSNTVQSTLDAPTALGLTHSGPQITLTWTDNSYNEKYFIIERSVNGGAYLKADSVNTNITTYAFTYSGFDQLKFRVYGKNPTQQSPPSNTAETLLDAPTNLQVTTLQNSTTLIWTDNSYNEKYFVIERQFGGGSFQKTDSVASNVTTYSQTSVNGLYGFRVLAANAKQRSGYSNVAQIVVTGLEPSNRSSDAYPVPAADHITLKLPLPAGNHSLLLINSMGQVMEEVNASIDAEGSTTLVVQDLTPGMYLLHYGLPGDSHHVLKFVKK